MKVKKVKYIIYIAVLSDQDRCQIFVHWTQYRRVDMKALAWYQIIPLGEQRYIGVNNLPKVVARQCMQRPAVESATSRSRVRPANHYTTKPPALPLTNCRSSFFPFCQSSLFSISGNKKTVLLKEEPRDAAVNFDMY